MREARAALHRLNLPLGSFWSNLIQPCLFPVVRMDDEPDMFHEVEEDKVSSEGDRLFLSGFPVRSSARVGFHHHPPLLHSSHPSQTQNNRRTPQLKTCTDPYGHSWLQ
jgi:hypothetical protein